MSNALHHAIRLPTADDTAALGHWCAARAALGDCFLLSGPIGAGKTHFARAFIQSLLNTDEDVPSPSFTLVQTYEAPNFEIWHADLYRLTHPDEVVELGLEDAFSTAVCLIEWPDRLGQDAPKSALSLSFSAHFEGRLVLAQGAPRHELALALRQEWAAHAK